jgi:hypothetical protein
MKKLTIICAATALMVWSTGCSKKDGIDNDLSFVKTGVAKNANKIFDISNDNSGKVTITPTAEGASSFTVNFGHGTGTGGTATVMPGNFATHAYPEGAYTVTIISKGLSGQDSTATYPLQVTYRAPENIKVTTTANVHDLEVSATADYAAGYTVYFGDVANEVGTPLAAGAKLKHTYATSGEYNLTVVALSGGAAKSQLVTPITIYDQFGFPISFDEKYISYFFGTFGDNQQFQKVANPNVSGLNMSANVGKFIRGLQGWSGTYSPLDVALDMSAGKKIHVLVYNTDSAMLGKKLNVELEKGSSIADGVAVLKMPLTKVGQWEELVFDFGTIAGIPAKEAFKQLVLRFNDAYEGTGTGGQGTVIYLDNFRQTN